MTGPGDPALLQRPLPSELPADPLELMHLAQQAAQAGAELIRSGELSRDGARPQVADTKSSLSDVVTAMDHAVEDLLVQHLLAARPNDGVLGEEHGHVPGTSGVTWVLDPIDGTVNYLYGIPAYAVSVAAVCGDPLVPGAWKPLAGCVLAPVTGQVWTAAAGHGAWLGGDRLRISAVPELELALVATGFGYRVARRRSQARVLAQVLPRIRDIRRGGSAALDLCSVASGTVNAYYERGVNIWDVAAAALVVIEAGGTVRGLGQTPPSPEMLIAAAPPLAGTLAALLESVDAASDLDHEAEAASG
jgi:myo-inositol-1(or 4)-monophosphatase